MGSNRLTKWVLGEESQKQILVIGWLGVWQAEKRYAELATERLVLYGNAYRWRWSLEDERGLRPKSTIVGVDSKQALC